MLKYMNIPVWALDLITTYFQKNLKEIVDIKDEDERRLFIRTALDECITESLKTEEDLESIKEDA